MDSFLDFHTALFSARHDDGVDINDVDVLKTVAETVGVDHREILRIVASGEPAKVLAKEHVRVVQEHGVFGVPTFIMGEEAVFIRFMERHNTSDLDRVLDMLAWTNLNEFKRTTIDR
jgi:predicted DsbA family dithiol-disulfide isomerase